jgi:hypothetical protein
MVKQTIWAFRVCIRSAIARAIGPREDITQFTATMVNQIPVDKLRELVRERSTRVLINVDGVRTPYAISIPRDKPIAELVARDFEICEIPVSPERVR